MPVIEPKVFEQYEYQNYLITIQDWCGTSELEGIAVPTQFAHLFFCLSCVEDSDRIFEKEGINNIQTLYDEIDEEYYEDDIHYLVGFDPNDFYATLYDIKTSNQVLHYIVDELNRRFEWNPKTIILKQINKKSIKPKSTKKQRGFNQVAWSTLVKLRDGKCTQCSSVYDLHAHHIKAFKDNEEFRYDVNNGITLCSQCHRKWHKENGR
jgi:hypothetical protein